MRTLLAVALGLLGVAAAAAAAGPPPVKVPLDDAEKGCVFTWSSNYPIGPVQEQAGAKWFFAVDYKEIVKPLPQEVDEADFDLGMLHKVPPHAGEVQGPESHATISIRGDGFANGQKITGKKVPNNLLEYSTVVTENKAHGAHWDVYLYVVVWRTQQGTSNIVDVSYTCIGSHSTNLMDGGPRLGKTAPGSDGKNPRMSIWGPNANAVPVGTPYVAILIEDTTLPLTTTAPLLMVSPQIDTAFNGAFTLPIDLAPHGAPGFELWVDPVAFLPGQAPLGNHHCEFGTSIPNDARLVGQLVWFQWMLHDPTANAAGLTFTEASALVITP